MPASSLSSLSSTNAGFWGEWRKIANFYPPSAGKSRSRGPSNRNRNRSSHTGDDLRRPYPNLIGGGEGEGLGGKFHVQHGRPRLLSSFVASKYYFAVRTIKKRKKGRKTKRRIERAVPFRPSFRRIHHPSYTYSNRVSAKLRFDFQVKRRRRRKKVAKYSGSWKMRGGARLAIDRELSLPPLFLYRAVYPPPRRLIIGRF